MKPIAFWYEKLREGRVVIWDYQHADMQGLADYLVDLGYDINYLYAEATPPIKAEPTGEQS